MKEVLLICGDYLKGKEIYPPVRRGLTLLINTNIASFLYEKIYGKYYFLDIQDYKGILRFFIGGNFFIPFAIFIIVSGLTFFASTVIFTVVTHFQSNKQIREIINYEVKKDEVKEMMGKTSEIPKYAIPYDLKEDDLINLYEHLRTELTSEVIDGISQQLDTLKKPIEANFHLTVRLILATTIYFFAIPQFGKGLYAFSMAILMVAIYAQVYAYRFLSILPVLIRKFHAEAEKYFLARNQK